MRVKIEIDCTTEEARAFCGMLVKSKRLCR